MKTKHLQSVNVGDKKAKRVREIKTSKDTETKKVKEEARDNLDSIGTKSLLLLFVKE